MTRPDGCSYQERSKEGCRSRLPAFWRLLKRKEGDASRQWTVDSRLLWGTSQRNKESDPTHQLPKIAVMSGVILGCPNQDADYSFFRTSDVRSIYHTLTAVKMQTSLSRKQQFRRFSQTSPHRNIIPILEELCCMSH
jgi:hypothetical protein